MEENADVPLEVVGKKGSREDFMLVVLIFFAFLSFTIVLLLYRWKVGSELSTDSGAWSDFGGYAGGVLGPVISFLTLVAVLITIKVQRQFLKVQENEFSKLYKLQLDTFKSQMEQARQMSADRARSQLVDRKSSLLKNIERFEARTERDIQKLELTLSESEASVRHCVNQEAHDKANDGIANLKNKIRELEARNIQLDALIISFTLTEHTSLNELQKHFHDNIVVIYS